MQTDTHSMSREQRRALLEQRRVACHRRVLPGAAAVRRTALAVAGALLAVISPLPSAHADTGGYSDRDATYYRLLTTGSYAITVTNFPLLVAHGQWACDRMATGSSTQDAIHGLMAAGPYSFATANAIVSSAGVSYCLSDLSRANVVDCERAQREGVQVDCDGLRRSANESSN